MRYSLHAGGKRLRPALVRSPAARRWARRRRALMPAACAIEMITPTSLIHDDLPAMDDDDLRRGRPTCHKVFGEAVAILAATRCSPRAFQLLAAEDAAPTRRAGWRWSRSARARRHRGRDDRRAGGGLGSEGNRSTRPRSSTSTAPRPAPPRGLLRRRALVAGAGAEQWSACAPTGGASASPSRSPTTCST
jgi:hypothetical protein